MTAHDTLKTNTATSSIDQDLRDLEEFPLDERLWVIGELFSDWRNRGVDIGSGVVTERALFHSGARLSEPAESTARQERDDGIMFKVLPGIPHPLDDFQNDDAMRSVGRQHPDFYQTNNGAVFIPVPQGYMAEVPANLDSYFQLSMSTCSCIVGYGTDGTIVAHISLSLENEAEAVLRYMKDQGIDSNDIYVIDSRTEGVAEAMGLPVVTSPDFYVDRGLNRANVIPFNHEYHDGSEDLATVVISTDGIRVDKALYDQSTQVINDPYDTVMLRA